MTRLRDLGVAVGRLEPGPRNALTDVDGVAVGHAAVTAAGLRTGVTAVLPYPAAVGERQLALGAWLLDDGQSVTGLGVGEDFGTLSSPIVLAPAVSVGLVYDALTRYGLGRNPALSTAAGWPPVVVGLDDTRANPPLLTRQHLGRSHLEQALSQSSAEEARQGSVGVGGGLRAFGYPGGVGAASRRCAAGADRWTVGALVAANGGAAAALCVDRYPIGPLPGAGVPDADPAEEFAAIVATDAPLLPEQLRHLAGRATLGLVRVGLLDAGTRQGVVLAFSTAAGASEGEGLERVEVVDAGALPVLSAGAAEACEEAVVDALLAAQPGAGAEPLPARDWPERVRAFQRARGSG